TERPGAVYLAVPEDIEAMAAPDELIPLDLNIPRPDDPSPSPVRRAATGLAAQSCSPATERPGAAPRPPCNASPNSSASRSPPPFTARVCSLTITHTHWVLWGS